MAQCKNCFSLTREQTTCAQCESPLHKDCAIKEDGAFFCDLCYTLKEEQPKVIEWELPEHIRRTYIETYRSCPFKFLKEVLEGNQQPATCYTQIGIDLHELFEKAILNKEYHRIDMQDDWNEYWDNYPDTLFESKRQKDDMQQRAQDSMDTFYAKVLPTLDPTFITEETIHYSIGEDLPLVQFTMDLVTENSNGNLDMHDWKTGGVMVGQKISSDLQAPLYIYGVQRHFNRQIDTFTFYYLKENKTRVFERIDDDNYVCRVGKREYKINLTDAIREVKALFSRIKKGDFNIPQDTRKMYFTCKMCHIKEIGECQGADIQAWHLK